MMDDSMVEARRILKDWKGDSYVFGRGVLGEVGELAKRCGKRALLVGNGSSPSSAASRVAAALEAAGVELAGGKIVPPAGPNAPREDVYRLESCILHQRPDCVVAVGGGSAIDACKAAVMLASLGAANSSEIEDYFGSNLVTKAMASGAKLLPLIAVQTAASSGAHLTKYANITDVAAGQKKLIVDDAITPPYSMFDYDVTATMPASVTVDGILDAIAHCFEVYIGIAAGKRALAADIAAKAIELVVEYAPRVARDPKDMEAREAIGLATDLGGYAIMVGGTNGAHLTSFSLVDIVGHGTACGIMNPYYAVLFAPAIQEQLRLVGGIFKRYGFIGEDLPALAGRELGIAVARGMVAFGKAIGAPTKLSDLKGFTEGHIGRALSAAKDPQLEMKLKNMPVPLTGALVDEYMGPVLRAAVDGDFSLIKSMV